MSGAEFLLVINFSIASLLAAAFLAIALYDRSRRAAGWFASAYLLGAVYLGIEFLIPFILGGLSTVALGYAVFLAALVLMNAGLARLYRVRFPWVAIGVLFVGSIAAKLTSDQLPRESFTRMMIYQAPYFMMQAIGVGIIVLSHRKRALDLVLAALLAVSAIHYILKPAIAVQVGGIGASPAEYVATLYAFVAQTVGAVLSVALALLLLVMLVRDLLTEITVRAETDSLSELYNRRGFELRFKKLAKAHEDNRLPVSLVLCDLDHFKRINDAFGHAGGDRVLIAFAQVLRDATMAGQVVGRTGGEEFAILLPGSNLSAARLFAESLRVQLAALQVDGLPAGVRVAASFGVAEQDDYESTESLYFRADAALYQAKNAGRDCVRVSLGSTLQAGQGRRQNHTGSPLH